MVFHMKTTLMVHDDVMKRVKEQAARRGTTISEIVESALRRYLEDLGRPHSAELPPLPKFSGGGFLVDVSDREELAQAFEGD